MHYVTALLHNIKYLAIGAGVFLLGEYVVGYNGVDFVFEQIKKLVGHKA